MRILAIIAARGGSKRVPGKNIRILGGKPLIGWTIEAAKKIPEICEILVSTDDSAIAEISIEYGAYVPWMRPPHLASDVANSVDVVLHALNWFEAERGVVDGVLLLQPTSPFRRKATIQKGINLFRKFDCKPVLGVSLPHINPVWSLKLKGDYLVPFTEDLSLNNITQWLPPAYTINGSFYLISPSELRSCRSFLGLKAVPLVIDSQIEAIDIDTEWDFRVAELMLAENSCNDR